MRTTSWSTTATIVGFLCRYYSHAFSSHLVSHRRGGVGSSLQAERELPPFFLANPEHKASTPLWKQTTSVLNVPLQHQQVSNKHANHQLLRIPWRILPGVTRGMYQGWHDNPTIRTDFDTATTTTLSSLASTPPHVIHAQSLFANATVVQHKDKGYYSVTGVQDDDAGEKFYKLQLVHYNSTSDGALHYGVLSHWGPLGTPGFAQELDFGTNRQQALDRVERKYCEKMGHVWGQPPPSVQQQQRKKRRRRPVYQPVTCLMDDADASDVLLTSQDDALHIIGLGFRTQTSSRGGNTEYVVETCTYAAGTKQTHHCSVYKSYKDADEHFRNAFLLYTGRQWHERHDDPQTTSSRKKKLLYRKGVPAAIWSGYQNNPTIRTNLERPIVLSDTSSPWLQVDPESKWASPSSNMTVGQVDGLPGSVWLTQDNEDGTSKFYLLQFVSRGAQNQAGSSNSTFSVVTRWGTVDAPGFMQELEFESETEAMNRFRKKFREKTGIHWNKQYNKMTPTVRGKYRIVRDQQETQTSDGLVAAGVVDYKAASQGGTIALHQGEPLDVMMALVDPAKSLDKFYVLQLIEYPARAGYTVFLRSGDTGTTGRTNATVHASLQEAKQVFDSILEEKLGYSWENRFSPTKGDKYRFVVQDFAAKQLKYMTGAWQYWVDDGVDGKSTGWYNYTKEGGRHVEQLYTESNFNANLANRVVTSGQYSYDVDLTKMVQTNVVHASRTSRRIRRCPTSGTSFLPASFTPTPPTTDINPSSPAKENGHETLNASVPAIETNVTEPLGGLVEEQANEVLPSNTSAVEFMNGTNLSHGAKQGESHPIDPDLLQRFQHNVTSNARVVYDSTDDHWYDVVLNQNDIESNKNKFYRIQLIGEHEYWIWTKWGRVGEQFAARLLFIGPSLAEGAKRFRQLYRSKTGNAFAAKPFVPQKGKYNPVEVNNDAKFLGGTTVAAVGNSTGHAPCTLDPVTKDLVEVLFSGETRSNVMQAFGIDLKRLPLGIPSEKQINAGIKILDKIKKKLQANNAIAESLNELSSSFYTSIPHSFRRSERPPCIDSMHLLQSKYDMCDILMDVHSTAVTVDGIEQSAQEEHAPPHPTDEMYDSLQANLTLVHPSNEEYELIAKYFRETKGRGGKLLNIWRVDRGLKERERHETSHGTLGNRMLLWHGTNIGVVAPILTNGLRIMPHSGGRVGSGVYMASMSAKSASYTVAPGTPYGCMFLCEAALGNIHNITHNAFTLKEAPLGTHSVLAVGETSPAEWASQSIEGRPVRVPQSKGAPSGISSDFTHDEFVVYDEAQIRLRYVVTVKL